MRADSDKIIRKKKHSQMALWIFYVKYSLQVQEFIITRFFTFFRYFNSSIFSELLIKYQGNLTQKGFKFEFL